MTAAVPRPDDLLTPGQVAKLLFVAPSTVTAWRESGKLQALPLPGGGHRYPADQPALAPFVARAARQRPASALRRSA